MKSLQRCCCLLLCLVFSLTLFSVTAKAEEVNIGLTFYEEFHFLRGLTYSYPTLAYQSGDGIDKKTEPYWVGTKTQLSNDAALQKIIDVVPQSGQNLIPKGREVRINLQNVYCTALVSSNNHSGIYVYPTESLVLVTYVDDTKEYLSGNLIGGTSTFERDLNVTFTPVKDVKGIRFAFTYNLASAISQIPSQDTSVRVTVYQGEWNGDGKMLLSIDRQSEESSLLGGIIGWIQNIFNKISDMANSIIELPTKLWNLISDGLKGLFVPSEEYMTSYKDKWDRLLADKLGAVYQASQIIFGAWDDIQNADEMNTINIPVVSIPLPENTEFSFGGYDVKIVPDGFDGLVTSLKVIGGIVCTLMFVNGLRKRYDEVMGGN